MLQSGAAAGVLAVAADMGAYRRQAVDMVEVADTPLIIWVILLMVHT